MSGTNDRRGHLGIGISIDWSYDLIISFEWTRVRHGSHVLHLINRVLHQFDPRISWTDRMIGLTVATTATRCDPVRLDPRKGIPVTRNVIPEGIHFTHCQVHRRVLDSIFLIVVIVVTIVTVVRVLVSTGRGRIVNLISFDPGP